MEAGRQGLEIEVSWASAASFSLICSAVGHLAALQEGSVLDYLHPRERAVTQAIRIRLYMAAHCDKKQPEAGEQH